MANQLKMAKSISIQSLHRQGWSVRRIARELGIDRATVSRHLRHWEQSQDSCATPINSNASKAPTGSIECIDRSNAAKAPTGSEVCAERPIHAEQSALEGGQNGSDEAVLDLNNDRSVEEKTRSECEPYRDLIVSKLEVGLTAQRIYQDLVSEHGFSSKYHSVRRFVGRLKKNDALPFRRMECAAGEEAQIDFGSGAPIIDAEGKRHKTHVLRVVLSYSRKGYSQAVFRQTTDNLIECLENAFWHFGGTPKVIVVDNLRAAVSKADWFDPDIVPKMRSFCEHYGIAILPTKPRMPRHKGKVERGVDYVQENALKGRKFASLEEQNSFLLSWETSVADTRIHGTTRKQVSMDFQQVERPALATLPIDRFALFEEQRRIVHRDGHIAVKQAYYSVPPEYLGRELWVRWDSRLVRVFNERMDLICVHVRQPMGKFSTLSQHISSKKISNVERGGEWLLRKVGSIGPETRKWSEALMAARGVESLRVLQGLMSLPQKHSNAAIENACRIALSYESFRLKTIRALIARSAPEQETFDFIQDHPIIREMSDYGDFVRSSFRKEVQER